MKPPPLDIDPLLLAFRRAHREFPAPKLTRCRGTLAAPILVIASRPTETDLDNNVPLTCKAAQKLHGMMKHYAEIDTETHCFVVPGSVVPKKPSKRLVEPFKSLPLKFRDRFKLIICVGGDNFKFIFGNGKKSSLQTLANGNLIYLPPVLGKVPLFVLPDIDLLAPNWDSVPDDQQWKLERMHDASVKWFNRILPQLGNHWRKLK